MARLPEPRLVFDDGCPDCGRREVRMPQPLPRVGDDFDWQTRDFDGFRIHMLEDMAARLPGRRFTRADLEVVLAEGLAGVLDQLSDMADRVFGEAYLASARRPESVLSLLRMIGFEPTRDEALASKLGAVDEAEREQELLAAWRAEPSLMDAARLAGRRRVNEQQRMVTLDDFAVQLRQHPVVRRAQAYRIWSGAYWTVRIAVSLYEDYPLDDQDGSQFRYTASLRQQVDEFNFSRGLPVVEWGPESDRGPTARALLRPFLEAYRMLGQSVELMAVNPVGVILHLCLKIAPNYFQSEIKRAAHAALGRGPGQFFEPGRLQFGESLYASDFFQALASLNGVQDVVLHRFKRVGARFGDESQSGVIRLTGLEIARCDNNPSRPEFGSVRISVRGGRAG